MKKIFLAAFVFVALLSLGTPVQAHEYDRDDSDYPLRYVAYALHPIGIALEYGILRPIHMLVSYNETTAIIFGHEPREAEDHDYMEFK